MHRVRNVTLVAVGDKASQKTDLLLKYTFDKRLGDDYEPAMFVNNVQSIIVDYAPYSVYFVDAESDDDYKILRLDAYDKADCFLLCYSIRSRESFDNVCKKWCVEIRRASANTPIILVATETEARGSKPKDLLVSTEEGENLKHLIGAAAFVECSAEEFVGVDEVFIEAVRSLYR